MFSWFDARSAKQFGVDLATFIAERSARQDGRKEKKAAAGAEKLAQEVARRVGEFRQQQALNFYKKAQLGNEFKWTLQQAGLPQERVDSWTTFVLSRL